MGRNATFDCLSENTGISASRHRSWTYAFVQWYASQRFPLTVRLPSTESEIEESVKQYADVALPGIIGSMDGTVIPIFAEYTSKVVMVSYKMPYTVCNVQMIVGHNRQIYSVSDLFRGSATDSAITALDVAVKAITHDDMYKNFPVSFLSPTNSGTMQMLHSKGLSLLVDGGYGAAKVLQGGGTWVTSVNESKYCVWIERQRKDVECTFGILKSR